MTKPIILVKICYKLFYIIQGVQNIYNFLASADIKVFGRTYLLLLIGLARFTPQVFLFSIYITWNDYDIISIILFMPQLTMCLHCKLRDSSAMSSLLKYFHSVKRSRDDSIKMPARHYVAIGMYV